MSSQQADVSTRWSFLSFMQIVQATRMAYKSQIALRIQFDGPRSGSLNQVLKLV